MSMNTYKKIKPAHVSVTMSNGQVIEGTINIGFTHRVSDFLSALDNDFIPIFNIEDSEAVVLLNKNQIASVELIAEDTGPRDREAIPEDASTEDDRHGDVKDNGVPVA